MSEWRHIDTAPKDGSTILLALASYGEQFKGEVWVGYWHDGSQNYWKRAGWYDEADRANLLTAKPTAADYWQPLPDPPEGP